MPHTGPCGTQIFDPLPESHPYVGTVECPACNNAFEAGDRTTVVPIGPGLDGQQVIKALAGVQYMAVCIAVHAACAGMPEEEHLPNPIDSILPENGQ